MSAERDMDRSRRKDASFGTLASRQMKAVGARLSRCSRRRSRPRRTFRSAVGRMET